MLVLIRLTHLFRVAPSSCAAGARRVQLSVIADIMA
jgi:hypothetical protein